MAVTTY